MTKQAAAQPIKTSKVSILAPRARTWRESAAKILDEIPDGKPLLHLLHEWARDEKYDKEFRLQCIATALPYVHARLKTVAVDLNVTDHRPMAEIDAEICALLGVAEPVVGPLALALLDHNPAVAFDLLGDDET